MIRKIIKIDEEKCNGCGVCAQACHEGAIEMIGGKAKLTREDYCDGLGDCLPECPSGAISFEEREAAAYDEKAVLMAREEKRRQESRGQVPLCSQLGQWPCQIRLAPVQAPYFNGRKLLIAADCTAYAYANVHGDFMKDRVTLIGCPKLDGVDYSEKLTGIIRNNDIKSVTVLRMEVPCCKGMELAVKRALENSGKSIPWQVVTISVDGQQYASKGMQKGEKDV